MAGQIGLCAVDSHNFPNLPLMKLAAWHIKQGDSVEIWNPLVKYDIVYKSKIFDFTPDIAYEPISDLVISGGTGYGLDNYLPPEIEHIMPWYALYPQFADTAYGFLTRGCPRNCKFCIVSRKEGCQSVKVADLSEFWQGQKKIKLLDPNLLACPQHEELLMSLAASGASVDFTQGLDIRLMTEEICKKFFRHDSEHKIKITRLHFAWDNPKEDLTKPFRRFKELAGLPHYKMGVYVLTNFNSTHVEDLRRIYTLRDLGYNPYVMIYDKQHAPLITRQLQRWCNNRRIFNSEPYFANYKPKK